MLLALSISNVLSCVLLCNQYSDTSVVLYGSHKFKVRTSIGDAKVRTIMGDANLEGESNVLMLATVSQ